MIRLNQYRSISKSIISCFAIAGAVLYYLLFTSTMLSAQPAETDLLRSRFDSYRNNALQEKLFVHTDKNFYVAGEILWLKLYDVDAFFHKPLAVSSVVYVEILNKENQPVLQAKISMEKGLGNGSCYIPVTIASGVYKLRAYTTWMKNFPAENYFEKTITIVNTREASIVQDTAAVPVFNIHFFPEGGNLVNNIQSKVAFHLTDHYGKGMVCSGMVKDNDNNIVANFNPAKFGMGYFLFTPAAGKKYTATITINDSVALKQPLPIALNDGFVMSTDDKNEDINIKVTATEQAAQASPQVYLFAHTRHSVKSVQVAVFKDGIARFTVSKSLLGEGISQLTIFTNQQQPVCERLYFKYPESSKLNLTLQTDKSTFGTRKKIEINIDAKDISGKPSQADMSLAVYRLDSLQTVDAASITAYLFFQSDISGPVESPDYYFNNRSNDTTLALMDNLMLTQGWRRFKWEDVLNDQKPVFQFAPELNGHMITGKMVDNITGKTAPGMHAYLTAPGTRTLFRPALSDSSGNIHFEMQNFLGSSSIMVQTAPDDATAHVEINNPFSTDYAPAALPGFTVTAKHKQILLDKSIAEQVQNIYNDSSLHSFITGASDSLPFYRYANQTYLLDNYTRFTTIEEIFREYVPYVNVRYRNSKAHLPVYNDALTNGSFEEDPLILLDGLPVFKTDKLMNYDALKIRKFDLVTRRYIYGDDVYYGIINFTTYKGSLDSFPLDPATTVIDYEALQYQREFFAPVYETEAAASNHLPDFRDVLYWSPNIKTDLNGKSSLHFYSSDISGKYVGILQALSSDGKCGNTAVYFEVK